MEYQLNGIEFNITNPNTVHFDKDNLGLLDKNSLSKFSGDNVLYYGCGSGILGLLLLKYNLFNHICFMDIEPLAIKYSKINLINNNLDTNKHTFSVIDILKKPIITNGKIYKFIICNPPQMPGPLELSEIRPDKYGGEDGLLFFMKIIDHAISLNISKILFLQTSFSDFEKLNNKFYNSNYKVETIKIQTRYTTINNLNNICPNLYEYIRIKQQKQKNNIDNNIYFKQRIAIASKIDN